MKPLNQTLGVGPGTEDPDFILFILLIPVKCLLILGRPFSRVQRYSC